MVKIPTAKAVDARDGRDPWVGRSSGVGNGNPLQDSCSGKEACLENFTDRGAWRALVHGVAKESEMTEHTHTYNKALKPMREKQTEQHL